MIKVNYPLPNSIDFIAAVIKNCIHTYLKYLTYRKLEQFN